MKNISKFEKDNVRIFGTKNKSYGKMIENQEQRWLHKRKIEKEIQSKRASIERDELNKEFFYLEGMPLSKLPKSCSIPRTGLEHKH